jgi:carbon monoxide dehydrogenase subunit G
MTKIETKKVEVNQSREEVFKFLSDFDNFEKLMPSTVTKWNSTSTECSFTLNGMATIGMAIKGSVPPSTINIVSHGKNPFEFTLRIDLEEAPENKTFVQLFLEAEINPFLKMMVEKPLEGFFNILTVKLKAMYE